MNIRLITLTLISTVASHCIANPSETTIRQRLETKRAELAIALPQCDAEFLSNRTIPSNRLVSLTIQYILVNNALACMNAGQLNSKECLCLESVRLLRSYRQEPYHGFVKEPDHDFVKESIFPQEIQKVAQLILNPEQSIRIENIPRGFFYKKS